MVEQGKCPQCGKAVPSDTPQGLCPACLLRRGLETNTIGDTGGASGARWTPPAVEQLAPLFPELDIIELIGRGGMGAVYKAREKQLDRLVALKVLPPEIGREDSLAKRAKDFAQRFAREAQAMAKLNHPNIVTIHSFGSREMGTGTGETAPPEPVPVSLYFFIMEYVDGLSLRQLLDAGTISPKEALAIVPQICDALQYAHDRGIVHRDIKPENILLNRAGQVKIADFGLAKLVGLTAAGAVGTTETALMPEAGGAPGVTQAGEKVMGTPQYMAPEQIDRPGEVDHRADIYSLGVVFYQMLTGELPVGRFEPPSRKVLIDVRLDEVVLRALEREPSRRYQQVSEVKTRVETIATSLQPTEPAEIGRKDGPTAPPAEQRRAGSSFRFGTAVRWTARILGTLWIGLLLLFVVGEGVPAIGGQPWAVQAGFIAMGLWMLGFILGWWRDGIASVVIVLGSILFHAVEGRPWLGGALELPGAIALLYALSWWLHGSARQPAADEPASTKHPFPLTPEQIQAINHARRAVKTPAIGMFVTGAIYLGLLIVAIIGAMTSRLPISTDNPAFPFVIVLGLAFLAANVFVLVAASNMKRLRNHRSAVAASILILFPLGSPLGLIFGIWALVVLSRWEVVEAFKTSERDRTRGKSRTLLWLVLAVVAVLTPVALWAASKAGQAFSKPESQPGGQIPSAAHFGSDKGSVYVVHAGDEVHYVFFHKGDFSSSTGSSQNAHSFTWIDKGSVKLANGQTFGFLRESVDPVHLSVNGKEFDLRQGRVLILHEDGSMEQIKLFPTMAVARSVDALAKAVDSATFTAQPAFGPVVERTINDLDDGKGDEGLVLATGQVVSLPPEFGRMSNQQRSKWIEDRGIDLFVEYVSNRWGFMSCGPQLSILNAGFEDVSPASIGEALVANSQLEVLKRGDWTFYLLPKESKAPLTLALRTPAGGVGVLQIVGFTDNPKGARIRYKLLQAAPSVPHVLKTTPVNFANDVDPSLDRITVTFDRPMMDKNWSFTAGDKAFSEKTGSVFPERAGEISYDAARTICTMPVKLQPGKVYWVGVNGPQHRNFKSADGTPARLYQILFATRLADGKPTPLPEELVKQAREISAAAQPAGLTLVLIRDDQVGGGADGPRFRLTVRNDSDHVMKLNSGDIQFHCTDSAGRSYTTPLPTTRDATVEEHIAPGRERLLRGTGCGGDGRYYSGWGPRDTGRFVIWATGPEGLESNRIRVEVEVLPATQPATQPVSASQVKLPEHAVWLQAAGDTARCFLAAMREGGKADPYSLMTAEYRQTHEGAMERLVERMDLSKAGPAQFAVAMEAACVVISPISPRNQDTPMSLGLGMIRIGDIYRIRDFDMLPSDEAVKRYLESFRKAYPAATVGFEGQAYRAELMRRKADLENELAAVLKKLGPEHPKTIEIQAKIRKVQMLVDHLEQATSRPAGKSATPLPEELVKQAREINPASQPATQTAISSAKGKDPEVVTELVLRVLRAMKEDDLATLKSLSAGSQQGWLEVDWMTPYQQGKIKFAGEPPVGWSESNLKSVTAEIRREVLLRNPDAATKVLQTLVQDDWAATLSPVTSSQYLAMVFVKTDGGWRFATLDQSKGNLADDLAKHMANIPKNLKVLRQLDHSSASHPARSTSSGPTAGSNRGAPMSQPIAFPATGPATLPAT